MSNFKKHVGRIKNTDRRCVVVYMQIPGNEDCALIADTDALPDRFHDALMDIVDSTEGQQTPHLYTLLNRRILPDLGLNVMNALHQYGLLRAVEIDNVVMYPAPSAPCPLRTIVDYMNGQESTPEEETNLANRVLENQKTEATQAQLDIAQNILRQADDLLAEAQRKREQAYRMVPSLRPVQETSTQVLPSPEVEWEGQEGPVSPYEGQDTYLAEHAAANEGMTLQTPIEDPDFVISNEVDVQGLPDDVKMALHAAAADLQRAVQAEVQDSNESTDGNGVDTSDDAVQEFLDRAAWRTDKADKELQESLKPKNPVGRPRNDGLPAGSKPETVPQPPKKRGRPPKASQ